MSETWKPIDSITEVDGMVLVSDGREMRTAFLLGRKLYMGSGFHEREATTELLWRPLPALPLPPADPAGGR